MSETPADPAYRFPERRSQPGSAKRNAPVIASTLLPLLREWGVGRDQKAMHLLDVGSGEGEQVASIAQEAIHTHLPFPLRLHPTEADRHGCQEIDHRLHGQIDGGDTVAVSAAQVLDIDSEASWHALVAADVKQKEDIDHVDIVLSINLVHIMPWTTVEHLFQGVNRCLTQDRGHMVLYGAFDQLSQSRSQGNQQFDDYLRAKDQRFGIRHVEHQMIPLAEQNGLRLLQRIDMPNGNLMLILAR